MSPLSVFSTFNHSRIQLTARHVYSSVLTFRMSNLHIDIENMLKLDSSVSSKSRIARREAAKVRVKL